MALPSGYQLVTELPTFYTFANVEILFSTTLVHPVFKTYLGKIITKRGVNLLGVVRTRFRDRPALIRKDTALIRKDSVNHSSVPIKFTLDFATIAYFRKRMLWIIPLIVWHRFNKSDIRVSQT